MTIPIYKSEINAGISELIQTNASIAYISPIDVISYKDIDLYPISRAKIENTYKNIANKYDEDLYLIKSILVTSCWNLNDDVFDKEEMWKARYTPEDKPVNIDHDDSCVIGHITDCWGMTDDGAIIKDDIAFDDLPDHYHLINSSVIYRRWSSQDNKEKVEKLISQIEDGTKFVSMECLLAGFDYAVQNDDSTYEIQPRNADSAFLSKYLKAYGGTGEYEGKRIGRLLRSITFCGKGFVDKPANPESIIFHKDNIRVLHRIINNKVYDNKDISHPVEDNNIQDCLINDTISRENVLMAEADNKSDDRIQVLETENVDLRKQLDEINESVKSQITDSEDKIKEIQTEHDSVVNTLQEDLKKAQETIAELEKVKEDLQTQIDEAHQKEIIFKRTTMLTDGGIDKDAAEKHVETFKNLNDEQFSVIVDTLTKSVVVESEETEESEESDDNEDKADAEVLDTVETADEADLAVETVDENKKIDEVRAGLVDLIKQKLNKK